MDLIPVSVDASIREVSGGNTQYGPDNDLFHKTWQTVVSCIMQSLPVQRL